jgi:hypothetical protein
VANGGKTVVPTYSIKITTNIMVKLSLVTDLWVVRFQVLKAASMMFRVVFWDILPCKMIVDRRFRGAYCLHHQGDEC